MDTQFHVFDAAVYGLKGNHRMRQRFPLISGSDNSGRFDSWYFSMNGHSSGRYRQRVNPFNSETEKSKWFCVLSTAKSNQKEHRQIEIWMP
jgi:hypothetical protein